MRTPRTRPVRLELRPLESERAADGDRLPARDRAGRTGDRSTSPTSSPPDEPRYGTLRDALGGARSTAAPTARRSSPTASASTEPADASTGQNAPKAQIIENIIKFGPVKACVPVRQKRTFTLSNTGECRADRAGRRRRAAGSPRRSPRGRRIAGGQFASRRGCPLDPGRQDYGVRDRYLVMIVTNDPAAPDAAAAGDGNHRRVTTQCGLRTGQQPEKI